MLKKHPSPAVGKGSGTQLEARRGLRGRLWGALRPVVVAVLALQLACTTSYPMGATLTGTPRSWRRVGGTQVTAEVLREDIVVANLRRAAKLPWTDGDRCVVEEAG